MSDTSNTFNDNSGNVLGELFGNILDQAATTANNLFGDWLEENTDQTATKPATTTTTTTGSLTPLLLMGGMLVLAVVLIFALFRD